MQSTRHGGSSFTPRDPTADSFSDSSSDCASIDVDQLREELGVQRAILVSLLDLPRSPSTDEDIRKVRLAIGRMQRQLNEASIRAADTAMDDIEPSGRHPLSAYRRALGTPNPSHNPAPSTYRADHGPLGRTPLGKRPFDGAHLDVDTSSRGTAKSRRITPGLNAGAPLSSAHEGSGDYQEEIIDLTGDDDSEWRAMIERQKEAMAQASRRKAIQDRDAALARELDGRRSPSASGPSSVLASQSGQNNNAFDRLLAGSRTPSWASSQINHIKQEHGPAQPYTALSSGGTVDVSYPEPRGHTRHLGSPAVKSELERQRYRMPGSYVNSEDENEVDGSSQPFPVGSSRLPQPTASSSTPSLPPLSSWRPPPPVPQMPPSSARLATGVDTNTAHRGNWGVPGIELALQYSMARQHDLPARYGKLPDLGPHVEMFMPKDSYEASLNANRPGHMKDGSYSHPSPPPGFDTSLAATIGRVNSYDFQSMTDGDGNPFNERLTSFIEDYVNDPRKTEEDIKQLLSNIRPDMEIPEEERGETPEAMRYPLYPHQQLALKWMSDMEEGTNKGGILADDMGLGKTISTLALMVSRPAPDNVKTNLIIGPVALVKQWELEVKKKLKTAHQLSVFLLHSKKQPYSELRRYDVVLTTYGLVAAEWRRYTDHVNQRRESPRYSEDDDMELARKCPILHPRSKFYRVILDEAQCIKNKDTQGSRAVHRIHATYRWCLTGTPMMNGVSELYSLIRFLRIRPYCEFTMFQRAFKRLTAKSNTSDYSRENAMRKLQAVLKAMMLRRMKNSMIDGKPILTLPPKTEHSEYVVFSDDERQFYRDLESRSQVLFNKFLRAGTVGKNYSNILVLLLRLRQACCHPHLTEFDAAGAATSDVDMIALAKTLERPVIDRIKAIEAFECPICYDGVQDPVLALPCGHDTCTECFASLTETNAQNNIQRGDENGAAKCPVCRGPVEPTRVITLTAFRKVHAPEVLEPGDTTIEDSDDMSDSDSMFDSDDSSDDDDRSEGGADIYGNLAGFVVPDDVGDGDNDGIDDNDIDDELDAAAQALKEGRSAKGSKKLAREEKKRRKKAEGKKKRRAESEASKPVNLKQLRAEADKNKEARRRYLRYLRDNWQDSAKVTEVMNLLEQIQETEKTIIFSQWTGLLDMIECQIKAKLGLRYSRYTGKMSRPQRDEAVRDFSDNPRNRVMLVSLRAGNAGLNLTAASRIIVCDPFWNPFIEAQAVDRAHRIGQQREVRVHRLLVRETVEDRILALQESKRKLVEAALDEGQSKDVGRLSEQELAYLFGVGSARQNAAGPVPGLAL